MAAAAEKRELHDLNNTRIKHGVPCYNMLDVSEILTSITRSFRIHCHLCLHVKKRFPKRKIKAWIVQTLLACSKLLSPIQTKINSAINPWFILYQLNIVLIKIKDIPYFNMILLFSITHKEGFEWVASLRNIFVCS